MKCELFLLAAILGCSSAPAHADTPAPAPAPAPSSLDLVEGQWKITRLISLGSAHTKTNVPATTQCLTKAAPLPDAAPGWPTGATCTPKFTVDGKVINWSFTCTQDNTTIEGSGPLTFAGKKLTGQIKVEKRTVEGGGMSGVRGLMNISATYVGPCKP